MRKLHRPAGVAVALLVMTACASGGAATTTAPTTTAAPTTITAPTTPATPLTSVPAASETAGTPLLENVAWSGTQPVCDPAPIATTCRGSSGQRLRPQA